MKHTLKVTIALVILFFLAQIVGLFIINQYIDHKATSETKVITYKPLPYEIERPRVENQSVSFIYITIALTIGTLLVLLLIKLNKPSIWRFWFFITVWMTLSIALAAFINNNIGYVQLVNEKFVFFVGSVWFLSFFSFIDNFIAMIIALILSIYKLYKPNIIIQNLSEIFIYGGLASIFVPMINLFAAFMLLLVISIYDFIAVFKTKHMVKLATFQSESNIFAGLFIPYQRGKISLEGKSNLKPKIKKNQIAAGKSVAVLGGGDIGFTLIFAGVVMKDLMLQNTILLGFLKTLVIPVCVSIALLVLLLKGQQNKFYPAMPVLSLGCLAGYLIVWLI